LFGQAAAVLGQQNLRINVHPGRIRCESLTSHVEIRVSDAAGINLELYAIAIRIAIIQRERDPVMKCLRTREGSAAQEDSICLVGVPLRSTQGFLPLPVSHALPYGRYCTACYHDPTVLAIS
jgi:hypothetical protein